MRRGGGVAIYLVWPSDWALWVGMFVFCLPGFVVLAVLEEYDASGLRRAIRSIRSRVLWTTCVLVAVAGVLIYLLWPSDRSWGLGLFAVVPLAGLMIALIESRRSKTGEGPQPGGGESFGPVGPPMA